MGVDPNENPKESVVTPTSDAGKELDVPQPLLSASSDLVAGDDDDISEQFRAEEDRILLDEGK